MSDLEKKEFFREFIDEIELYSESQSAKWVNKNIRELNRMQKEPAKVEVPVGEQCCKPYECWYYEYYH